MIAYMRHGERADWAPNNTRKYDIPFDAPLTEEGEK